MTAPTWDGVVADLATLRAAADTQTAAAKAGADLLAAATAANATLSAELASVRVSTPTLYGAAAWLNPGETWTDGKVWTRLGTAMGPLGVRRVYDGGQGLGHAIDVALAAQQGNPKAPVIVSWKDYDFAGIKSAARRAYYATQWPRLTPGMILAPYHEYDRKVLKTLEYDRTTVGIAWAWLRNEADHAGVTNKWASIVTGYNLANTACPLITDADYIGIDPYPLPGQTALDCVGPMLDAIAKQTDLPVAVCEIARWATVQDAELVASLGALRGRVSHVCWFNAPGAGPTGTADFRIDTSPAATVYKALTA